MKINYAIDERIEFFSSLLTVNNYWDSLAKKFWGKEMMKHPYKEDVIKFFSKFKTEEIFSFLENFCASLHDFSVLLELPFFIPLTKTDTVINNNELKKIFKKPCFEKLTILIKDFYKKSNYNDFFSSIDKTPFYLPNEAEHKILKGLDFLQSYTSISFDNINIYIAPLVLGNFLIPLFETEITIVLSPYDYQDKYLWGKPEDYVLQSIIENISITAIEKIKKQLQEKKKNFLCKIPYYNTVEAIVSKLLCRIILIRVKSLFYKEDKELLLEKESENFPNIKFYYERLINSEKDCKFTLDSVNNIFLS